MLNFSILFFIKKSKLLRNDEAPIYLRVTIDKRREEISTKRSILPSLWNSDKQCARGNTRIANELNTFLENEKIKLRSIVFAFQQNNTFYDAKAVMDVYLGKNAVNTTILDLFQKHNDDCLKLVGNGLRKSTVDRYITCRKLLKSFIGNQYKRSDINIREVDHQFIRDFELYLRAERKCNNNTTIKYLKNFKKITKIALDNGMSLNDPFLKIKFRLDKVLKEPLTLEEINIISSKKFDNKRIERVRDIFIFGCYTALSYQDMKTLSEEHLHRDDDGTIWIKKNRYKTNEPFIVPLLSIPLYIIEKYAGTPERNLSQKLLPVLSNQKMNSYLKEIADSCGITKNLHMHLARHTFATTIALEHGIPIHIISRILGHSTAKMTEKYARTQEKEVKKAILGIKDQINKLSN